MADADIGRLIAIIEREEPLHKELLQAMINRFKKGGNSVVTASGNEAQVEAAKAAAIEAFNAVKADPSDENKTALQNAEAVYYAAVSNLVDDAPEAEKEFQHYMLGKLKGSAIDVEAQVAAGADASNMPELEDASIRNAEEDAAAAASTRPTSAATTPTPAAPAGADADADASNMPELEDASIRNAEEDAAAAATTTPTPAAPAAADADASNMPELENASIRNAEEDAAAAAATTPTPAAPAAAPAEPTTNNNMSGNPAFAQFAANSFANEPVTAEEPVSEPNGNNMRKLFGNDSNAFTAETPAPETPVPVTTPAPTLVTTPAATPVPEGWEKEEFEEYKKLTEAQKKTYDEIKPTIGLNNSVKNWKDVIDIAKGVEKKNPKGKKTKQKGGAKGRSVTPIGNKLDISLKKAKKSKTSKTSKTSKKSKTSKTSKSKKTRKSKA